MLTPRISLRNQQTSPCRPSRLFSSTGPSPTRPRSRLRSSSHSLLPSGTCARKQRRSAAPLQRFRPRWSASQYIPDIPRPMGEFNRHQWAALLQARKISPPRPKKPQTRAKWAKWGRCDVALTRNLHMADLDHAISGSRVDAPPDTYNLLSFSRLYTVSSTLIVNP
jgi:hypothetical protein